MYVNITEFVYCIIEARDFAQDVTGIDPHNGDPFDLLMSNDQLLELYFFLMECYLDFGS